MKRQRVSQPQEVPKVVSRVLASYILSRFCIFPTNHLINLHLNHAGPQFAHQQMISRYFQIS